MNLKTMMKIKQDIKNGNLDLVMEAIDNQLAEIKKSKSELDLNKLFKDELVFRNINEAPFYIFPADAYRMPIKMKVGVGQIYSEYDGNGVAHAYITDQILPESKILDSVAEIRMHEDSNKAQKVYLVDYVEVPKYSPQTGEKVYVDMFHLNNKGEIVEFGRQTYLDNGKFVLISQWNNLADNRISVRLYNEDLNVVDGFNVNYNEKGMQVTPFKTEELYNNRKPSMGATLKDRLNERGREKEITF